MYKEVKIKNNLGKLQKLNKQFALVSARVSEKQKERIEWKIVSDEIQCCQTNSMSGN